MVELLADLGADADWTGPNEVRVDAAASRRRSCDEELCRRSARRSCSPARCSRASAAPSCRRPAATSSAGAGSTRTSTRFARAGRRHRARRRYDLRRRRSSAKRMFLDEASVMATENAVMAAVLAKGETIVGHAACEPHIQDLCHFLVSLGARIEGIGSNILRIEGVDRLGGGDAPDPPRARRGGELRGARRDDGRRGDDRGRRARRLISIVPAFRRLGIEFDVGETTVRVPPGQELHVVDDLGDQIPKIESGIWPAFPADLTSIAVVAATQARGTVLVFEKMFESRLFFVDKLVSMGARIILCDPHRVVVTGPGAALRPAAREPRHPRRHGDGDRRALRRGHARRSATSARSTAATSGSTSACGRSARRSSGST